MLTILASYAQEESRSASENQKWRVRKDFKDGKFRGMPALGYCVENGVLTIIQEEAELVQAIFADYLSGMGVTSISKKYHRQGVKISPHGICWMLRNEKYGGDMLLQKSFIADHISKRSVINVGQLPLYHVTNSHKPIIPKPVFEEVQAEIQRRREQHQPKTAPEKRYPFTGLIRCGTCGAAYKRKHTHAGEKYDKIVWICSTFNVLGRDECDSQQIPEDILIDKTLEALCCDEFDEIALRTCIEEIRVPEHNRLVFVFADGHEVSVDWKSPSRSESWTPEMKEAARQQTLARQRKEISE
jgi:hypothetical protein